jgi:N-acetylglutamate synthase-like GNAT family acetyltransferase
LTAVPLRRATADDAAAVAGLINAAFQVERFFVEGDRTNAGEVRALMGKGSFLLAEEEGRLAGCVYLERRGDRGYFGLLAVDPARQEKGLGRALVAAAEEEFRAAGCRAVDIQVVDLRTELPPFYRRLGYAETGTAPFPDDARAKRPCHFIRMSKPLEAERA